MKRPDAKTENGHLTMKTTKKLQKNLIDDKKLVLKNLGAYKKAEREDFFS